MAIRISYHRHCTSRRRIYPEHGRGEQYYLIPCKDGTSLFLKIYPGGQGKKQYTQDRKDYTEDYRTWYDMEYRTMSELYRDCGKQFSYFPQYYQVVFDEADINYPAVCMDYIAGCTLDEYLHQHASPEAAAGGCPALYLSPRRYRHLMEQLKDILAILRDHGIIYLDLKPENIIIRDTESFDISLVDYTFCQYRDRTRLRGAHVRKSCDLIRLDNLTEEQILIQAAAFFHAFLLYGGNIDIMAEQISRERINGLMSSLFTGYNINLGLIYPSGYAGSSAKDKQYQEIFYRHYPTLESYFDALMDIFDSPATGF